MISRLDVAVDRRRRARPLWRADLCRQRAALEPVTERIPGTIPMLAGGRTSCPRKRYPTSYSPTGGFDPAKAVLRVLRCRLPYDLEQILR